MLLPVLLILAGLALLVFGGELLVRGATNLASIAKVDPLIVGLTVVAFGTSAPEMAVCLQATLSGQPDIAMGNVVGSNIANILLILGACAAASPLVVNTRLVRLDVPVMIAASLALFALAIKGHLNRIDGGILLSGLVFYLCWLFIQSRREKRLGAVPNRMDSTDTPIKASMLNVSLQFLYLVISVAILVGGSNLLVNGASQIARVLGVSDLVIGLTAVSVGTSLPELAACLMAVLRGRRDLAVGNCVGSNILNILAVLGITGVVAPEGVNVSLHALQSDIPIMIVVAFACLPVFASGGRINRWEGCLFLAYFLLYYGWLFLLNTNASVSEIYAFTITVFILPLTVITFSVITYRSFLAKKRRETLK
ncbi:MAG: calcium/sodium antiporter [Mariniblastus sp.]|nr:calcium/sodium antiporter [Mariniblastus sp.]